MALTFPLNDMMKSGRKQAAGSGAGKLPLPTFEITFTNGITKTAQGRDVWDALMQLGFGGVSREAIQKAIASSRQISN